MPPRKELCRNFQRGSCQYGARCKFIHAAQQGGAQQSSNNPFGFGAQTSSPFQQSNQQQTRNPFGFGVQNNSQPRGGPDSGSNSNQPKPFQNTWSRFSPITSSSAPASRQSGSQSKPPPIHQCINPEDCKRIMAEDFENEKPLWKLTCYGHNKDGSCDIVGDISPEELRALAYDDAKQGKSLQLIVERERNLLNSKLAEFQNLLHKPYAVSSNAALGAQNPFAGNNSNFNTNSGVTPPVSSFSQLGPSLNTGSAAAPSYAFGQPSAMQNNANPSGMVQNNLNSSSIFQTNNASGAFGIQPSSNNVTNPFSFGQGNSSNNVTNPFSSGPGNSSNNVTNPFSLGPGNSSNNVTNPFSLGPGNSSNNVTNPFSLGPGNSSNNVTNSFSFGTESSSNKNPFSTSGNSTQFGNAASNQSPFVSNVSSTAPGAVEMSSISTDNLPNNNNVDDKVWTKSEWSWNKGEIPEEAPSDIHVR